MHAKILRLILILSLLAGARPVWAQGTAFTYQGQLVNGGSPASGTYNLTFTLFNNNTSGVAIAGPVTNHAVEITNGLFTVLVDFGTGAFTGVTNWLQLGVATNGVTAFTALSPRQQLTPTPYAIYAESTSNLLGTLPTAQLSGTVSLAQLPGAVVTNNETSVTLSNVTVDGSLTLQAATVYSGTGLILRADASTNFFAGAFAGNLTTSGGANTGIGDYALNTNTSGTFNTALGFAALSSNRTGGDNTAVGGNALYSNTNGQFNTAVGFEALVYNTSGNDNTAAGWWALEDNTMGGDNTANGYAALHGNTIGSVNTANGSLALELNQSGSNNVAVGSQALRQSTNDNNVVAIGGQALSSANAAGNSFTVSGNGENTAVGYAALYADTTGAGNTAVGSQVLFNNTSGNGNTAIGDSAMSAFTSGSNNIAVGYQAGVNLATGNNNIYLGNPGLQADNGVIRIGAGQTNTYIAGLIIGNGGGVSNLLAANMTGPITLAQLPSAVVTNSGGSVTLSNVTVSGILSLPALAAIDAGGSSLLRADAENNFYAGPGAGTAINAGSANTAIGSAALQDNTNGTNNTAIGYLALGNNTNGAYNTAIGERALDLNSSGNDNTATGRHALEDNTVGSDNTANGFAALSANTVGRQNVAVGSGALGNSTNDNQVVAIGYQALQNDNAYNQGTPSTNGQNTAVGYQALQANTTGNNNTALGYQALATNTIGDLNTAIGAQTLQNGTNGYANTAIGAVALEYDANGYYNTAIGAQALQFNANGYYNTAIGAAALLNIWYGTNNTAIGAGALINVQNNSSGNIAIGVYAGTNLQVGNNNIYIGHPGKTNESGLTRIGTTGVQTHTYLAGNVALDGALNPDQYGSNTGNVYSNALVFGASSANPFSGEGIASKRVGANPYDLEFFTDYTNRMTILNGGNVGIGTTNPDALLSVNGTADKPGGGSWGTFSDARLKDVGADFTHGLEALDAIQPVHYHYKLDNALHLPSQPDYVGVVAQQVQGAIPEAVQQNRDGYLVVNNDPIIWTMFNAIKELNQEREAGDKAKDAEMQQLKAKADKVEALEKQLNELEAVVKTLTQTK